MEKIYATDTCTARVTCNFNSQPELRISKEILFKNHKLPGSFIYLNSEGVLKQVCIKRVIFSNPATIVMWDDGTKTKCKCSERDQYNAETGLIMCIMKKLYGNTAIKEVLASWVGTDMYPKNTAVTKTLTDVRKFVNNQ